MIKKHKPNICLDGFALSLKRGTGLATYSRELAQTLSNNQFEVSLLYGMDRLGRRSDIRWSRFIQRLMVFGEAEAMDFRRFGQQALTYSLPFAVGLPFRPRLLRPVDWVENQGLEEHLPIAADIYNLPAVFRVAQLYSFAWPKPLSLSLPGKKEIDLFHSTSPLPIHVRGMPNVLTIHDLIPLTLPHSTQVMIRHYRNILRSAIKRADQIFVISKHSKKDLQRIFGVSEDRIHLTYQSVCIPQTIQQVSKSKLSHILSRNFDLKPQEYFLFFGAIEPKKNVMRIVNAAGMAKTGLPLVIAGRNGWLYDRVNDRIKQIQQDNSTAIRRYFYLPRTLLMYLLKGAKALIFPSLYEGFGLPVLEAMIMGVPVITSHTSSLPEIGGEAPLYVNPYKTTEIAEAMEKIANDPDLCSAMIEKGSEQAERFSPDKHVNALQEGYTKARDLYHR